MDRLNRICLEFASYVLGSFPLGSLGGAKKVILADLQDLPIRDSIGNEVIWPAP